MLVKARPVNHVTVLKSGKHVSFNKNVNWMSTTHCMLFKLHAVVPMSYTEQGSMATFFCYDKEKQFKDHQRLRSV